MAGLVESLALDIWKKEDYIDKHATGEKITKIRINPEKFTELLKEANALSKHIFTEDGEHQFNDIPVERDKTVQLWEFDTVK